MGRRTSSGGVKAPARLSFIWAAISGHVLKDKDGMALRCKPVADPHKVIYATEHAASCAARLLAELGQGGSEVYECPRNTGAYRQRHWHLTKGDG